MRTGTRSEEGETLVEIILAVVILGLVVSALFASFTTASRASNGHRNLVSADAALRNAAEATKAAVRADCPTSTTYTTTTTTPAGYVVTNSTYQCPDDLTSVRPVTLEVTLPNGIVKALSIDVRTP